MTRPQSQLSSRELYWTYRKAWKWYAKKRGSVVFNDMACPHPDGARQFVQFAISQGFKP